MWVTKKFPEIKKNVIYWGQKQFGVVYTMFAISLICIINNKKCFLWVAKFSFEKQLFEEKSEDYAEIVRLF